MMKEILFALIFFCVIFAKSIASYSIIVAKDGSGNFTKIQEAIDSAPFYSEEPVVLNIKKGRYYEKLYVPKNKTFISLIGENRDDVILDYDDFSGKLVDGQLINTFTSYTLFVEGNDFHAQNVTIRNSAGPVGQAVALSIYANRSVVKDCNIVGNQDTLLVGDSSHSYQQYFENCFIEGTTDFIFGSASVIFQHCLINSLKNSYITAAATPQDAKFGYVFIDCKLTASSNVNKVYLGRPWRPYASVIFIKSEMGSHIVPEGWSQWNSSITEINCFYAEYKSTGPGANPSKRVPWSHQLTDDQVSNYTIANLLIGWTPDFI